MRRFLSYLLILLSLPAFAQIGRYKSIPTGHYNYTLKLDTATGAVWSVKFDSAKNATVEKKILAEKFKDYKAGRFDLITTDTRDHYLLLDSSTGKYTILDWQPEPPKEARGANKPPKENVMVAETPDVSVPDARAIFPGLSNRDTLSQTSAGQPEGNVSVGVREGDSNARVEGRSVTKRGRLKPISSGKKGLVVVDIWLDESGHVIEARVNSSKSTTMDQELVRAALEAAKEFEFTPATNPSSSRTGSITVSFNHE